MILLPLFFILSPVISPMALTIGMLSSYPSEWSENLTRTCGLTRTGPIYGRATASPTVPSLSL